MDQYFSTKIYPAKNAKRVLFFFPAGFSRMWHYRWTVFLLNRMGVTVIGFDFAWKKAIRDSDFSDLVDLVELVDKTVGKIISRGPRSMQYSTLGISFGSILSLYTAKRHKSIRSIILFVPYGTLSNLLWTFKPAKSFIERLMKNGIRSERELEKLTQPIETQYKLNKLRDRKIVSFLGKNDKIVFDGEKL